MWIVEINFAGRRFTHRVPDRKRTLCLFKARTEERRSSQQLQPQRVA